jgi:predicted permease
VSRAASHRVYRLILRLLPRDFRERFGAEMISVEREISRQRGETSWHHSIALFALARTAVALRIDALRGALALPSPREALMNGTLQDLRFALRALRRDPLFSAFAILTLGLGIGAAGAVYGVVDRLVLRGPDHVVDSKRVVRLYVTHQPNPGRIFTAPDVGHVTYELVRSRVHAFNAVASYTTNESTYGRGADARAANVTFASASFFPLLGVEPELGRFFTPAEDGLESAERVAVISHAVWVTEFGRAADAIGRTVLIGERPYEVVGVAPAGFTGAELSPVDFWVPMNLLSPTATTGWQTAWNAQWMKVIGRLAPGVTMETAGTELTGVFRSAYAGDEESMKSAILSVASLDTNDAGGVSNDARVTRWLFIVAGILLAAVCANLINLMIARGVRRAPELSVRLALGAGRTRVRRLLLIEALTLAGAAGVAALAVASVLGSVARSVLLSDILWSSPPVNGRVLAMTVAATVVVGMMIGVVPAIRSAALAGKTALAKGVGDPFGRRSLLRSTLSVAQAGLSTALLIGAGLFVMSLANARSTDFGIEPETLIVDLRRPALSGLAPEQAAIERARRRTFPADALERLASLPGIADVAVAVGMPFGNRFSVELNEPGRDSVPRLSTGIPSISAVSPDYFRTIGTRIVRGRGFEPGEGANSERVMIVSETMAATFWPGENPLGKCLIAMQDTLPCARVVGVAADTHRGSLREPPSMHYYIPLGQEIGFGGSVIVARVDGDLPRVEAAIADVLTELDPTITRAAMETVQDRIDPQLRPWRLGTSVLSSAGLLALFTVMVGVYGVTSYLVTMRTREIGLRVALGASAGRVAGLVLRSVLLTTVLGVLLGSAGAYAAGKFLEPLMLDVSPREPAVFAGAAAALLLSSLLACVLPVLRANRIDPIEALRSE